MPTLRRRHQYQESRMIDPTKPMKPIDYPLPPPYKTFSEFGMSFVKVLLDPAIKSLIDKMRLFKGCYVGVSNQGLTHLYIDNQPSFVISSKYLSDIKILLADDVKEYHDITEYRLSESRFQEIMIYYQK